MERIGSRSSRTRRGVKARLIRIRIRVCSGGSSISNEWRSVW